MVIRGFAFLQSPRSWVVAVLAGALVFMWSTQITTAAIETDAQQSTRMAVNLARHGVISLDETAPYRSTNFREPVPVFVSALGVVMLDSILGPSPTEAYLQGPRAKYLKYQNLLWSGLLSASAFLAINVLTASFWLAMVGVLVVNLPLLPQALGPVDNLLTELPATAILMLSSTLLAVGFKHRMLKYFILMGALFGILTLIKAVVLYVFLGVLLVLTCLYLYQRRTEPRKNACGELAALIAAFCFVVAPWAVRNHMLLGTYQITQRGGESLWERSIEDQITFEEYLGTFYIWSRPGSLHNWLGRRLHLSARDLERGGRVQRLNSDFSSALSRADRDTAVEEGRPEKAITLFRQAQAERTKLENEFAAAGSPHPDIAAERELYARAAASIVKHPWRHLALTVSFMWRGAPSAFPVLALSLWVGWIRKRFDLLLFALPAFGIVLAYALFTPFFSRYGWPSRLIALVAVLPLIKELWDAIVSRLLGRPRRVLPSSIGAMGKDAA